MAGEAEFEVLAAGAMRAKYGLTAENRPTIRLNPANVPDSGLLPAIQLKKYKKRC
jgi:hypothetical protein